MLLMLKRALESTSFNYHLDRLLLCLALLWQRRIDKRFNLASKLALYQFIVALEIELSLGSTTRAYLPGLGGCSRIDAAEPVTALALPLNVVTQLVHLREPLRALLEAPEPPHLVIIATTPTFPCL